MIQRRPPMPIFPSLQPVAPTQVPPFTPIPTLIEPQASTSYGKSIDDLPQELLKVKSDQQVTNKEMISLLQALAKELITVKGQYLEVRSPYQQEDQNPNQQWQVQEQLYQQDRPWYQENHQVKKKSFVKRPFHPYNPVRRTFPVQSIKVAGSHLNPFFGREATDFPLVLLNYELPDGERPKIFQQEIVSSQGHPLRDGIQQVTRQETHKVQISSFLPGKSTSTSTKFPNFRFPLLAQDLSQQEPNLHAFLEPIHDLV